MAEDVKPAAKKAVAKASDKVRILSKREGDVIIESGIVKFDTVVEVSEDVAAWLEATFPGMMKRV